MSGIERENEDGLEKSGKTVPAFQNLEEESAFWDSHSPLEYGEWNELPMRSTRAGRE